MGKYVIEYKGGSIQLPTGETIVGRGLACRIRFNDPAVSRQHLRLSVSDDGISVEELAATNPTRLNGGTLPPGGCALSHDDVLELGNTWFRIAMLVGEDDEEQTFPGVDSPAVDEPQQPSLPPRASSNVGASSRSSLNSPALGGTLSSVIAATSEAISARLDSAVQLPKLEHQTCPRCRAKVPVSSDDCSSCGYHWPTGRPTSVTQRIDLRAVARERRRRKHTGPERREHPRVPVDLPVIYDSETLTFDAIARDISLGGLFLATELLDDEGSCCTVTILPDGSAAIPIDGEVSRVAQEPRAGMGIRFVSMSVEAKLWLSGLFRAA